MHTKTHTHIDRERWGSESHVPGGQSQTVGREGYLFNASHSGNLSQTCLMGSYMRSLDSSCFMTPSITCSTSSEGRGEGG